MKEMKNPKVALVQAAPYIFDKERTLEKVLKPIKEAALKKPDIIVFPELFIPGYPFGMTFGFTVGHRDNSAREDFKRYYNNSILVPGKETALLGQAAKEAGAYLSIGISEKTENNASLYNTNIIFDKNGDLKYIHRKLKPTGSERVIFADGQKYLLPILDSPYGKMGSLICWESYMPLARVALTEKGMAILIAPNTNDNLEWQDTIKHIAIESHVFYLNCNMIIKKENYPKDLKTYGEIEKLDDLLCRGGSSIVDPYGHYLVEPVWDKEEIIYESLNMIDIVKSRMEFDLCGHYGRDDVFNFSYKEI